MASRPSGHQPDTWWGEERRMRAQWDQNTGSSRDLRSWSISHFLDSLKEVMQELRASGMALTLTENRSWWDRGSSK